MGTWLGWDDTLTYEIVVGQTPFSLRHLDPMTGLRLENCETGLKHIEQDEGNWRYVEPLFADPQIGYLNLLVDTECASTSEHEHLAERGIDVNNKRWVSLNFSSTEFEPGNATLDTFPASLFANKCACMWDFSQHSSLHDFLYGNGFLRGNVKGIVERDVGTRHELRLKYYTKHTKGPREMLWLYNRSTIGFDNVRDALDDLATGFTNYVRMHGHQSYSEPRLGKTWQYAICLDIRWPWIVMPAAIWLGVAMVLCLSIVRTSRERVPVWKASTLPLLFRGPLDDTERSQANDMLEAETVSEMEKKAEEITVQLDRVHGGVSLCKFPTVLERL
ncbi:hypothetical protein HJFPF1_13206 [Paramyrothecium foliicola]|nr:hypothetical protein HJFPF1_13206 [Paramyrothecium foliicola]